MTTQTTFEATVEGRGDLPDIAVPIKRISNATLRHSALSNVDIEAAGVPDDIRQYATFFAPFELRVAFPNEDRAPERIFKGQLVEVEQSDTSAISTLKTVGRLIKLEKSDGFREFADIRAFEALRQYIDEETDFGAAVEDDPGTVVVDDGLAFEAATQSDFEGLLEGEIPDDVPITVENGRVTTLPTCFVAEGEDVWPQIDESGGSDFDADEWSGGAAGGAFGNTDDFDYFFETEYTIPQDSLQLRIRGKRANSDSAAIYNILLDGNNVTDTTLAQDVLEWDSSITLNPDGDIAPGTHRVSGEIDVRADGFGSDPDVRYDVIAVYDDRFNYNFDNVVHEPAGALDGPESHPDRVDFEWQIVDQETQVSACRILSTWDDTGGPQQLAASPNAGTDYLTASNTETLDVDFEGNDIIGTDLRIRTTHGRHSPDGPRDQTPRYGYAGQSIDNIEVRFDQISVAIIGPGGILFAENDLQNIKDLASLARYNFVVDHAGDADAIEAFPVGFENPDGVEWMPTGWSRRDGDQDYANRVVARGASKPEDERENPDDLRYEAAVRDDAEIERLTDLGLTEEEATQTTVVTDPELSTSDEVQAQAFNELEGVVGNRLPSGSIDIVPTFIPPGYAYPVEEFETVDGEVPSKVLEKVAYSEGYGQDAQGSLKFKTPRNWVSGLSPVEKDVIGIKRLF